MTFAQQLRHGETQTGITFLLADLEQDFALPNSYVMEKPTRESHSCLLILSKTLPQQLRHGETHMGIAFLLVGLDEDKVQAIGVRATGVNNMIVRKRITTHRLTLCECACCLRGMQDHVLGDC